MGIRLIEDPLEKKLIVKDVLDNLEAWFGLEEAKQEYIDQTAVQTVLISYVAEKPVGFAALAETSPVTWEIHCMGIHPNYHRMGLGRKLIAEIEGLAITKNYRLLQVKTVASGHYKEYDLTNSFYQAVGFLPLEVFPTLWDAHNPCQLYVKCIGCKVAQSSQVDLFNSQ